VTAIKQFRMQRSKLYRILFIGCLIFITGLVIIPDDAERGVNMPHLTESGFFMHSIAWFVAAFLGTFAFAQKSAVLVSLLFYSSALERLQYYIPYRTFNIMDICANVCGLALWLVLMFFLFIFNQFEDAKSQ